MPLTSIEVLNKVVESRVAETRLTSATFLAQLYAGNRMATKSNTSIDWDVSVSGGGAAIEAVTADGANTPTDNTVAANLRIGRYRIKHQFSLSRVDMAEAASRAPEELQDLFNAHVDRGLTHLSRTTNNLLYTGDGTAASGEMVGLNKVGDNTFAYAGINPVTYPAWSALISTNATARPLTKNILLDHDQYVKENEASYDFILCSPSMGTAYNKLFDTIGGGSVLAQNTGPNGLRNVELGYGVRTYMGRPIIEDPACPTGRLYFINMSDLTLFTFNLADSPSPKAQPETAIASTRAWGMNINVAELPSNNSAKRTFEMYVLPQLRLYNRKSLQLINQLT